MAKQTITVRRTKSSITKTDDEAMRAMFDKRTIDPNAYLISDVAKLWKCCVGSARKRVAERINSQEIEQVWKRAANGNVQRAYRLKKD
jgi:hypothetical protein